MNVAIKKIIVSVGVSVLSFLGWEPKDYQNILPKDLKEIILPTSTTTSELGETKKVDAAGKNIIKKTEIIIPEENRQKTSSTPKTTPPKNSTKPLPLTKNPVTQTPPQNPVIKKEPPQIPLPSPTLSLEDKIKNSVANIYCLHGVQNGLEKITGSASAIAPGVYLTNAHVALYILLENSTAEYSCFIRQGSPAKKMYKAEIVYFPKSWAQNNVNYLSSSNHIGTGEKDYAIIKTSTYVGSGKQTPTSFLEENISAPTTSDTPYLAGYPARDGSLLDSSLYEILQKVTVTETLHFQNNTADAVSTSPTLLAVQGSSGGAMVDSQGLLQGIMGLTTIDPYSGEKNIRAITLSYINSDLQNESGKNLLWFTQNATIEANNFKLFDQANIANLFLGK